MKTGKRAKAVWILLLVLVLFAAVRLFTRHFVSHPVTVQIYYPEKNNLFLVPVSRQVKQAAPGILLAELEKPPRLPELLPALHGGWVPGSLSVNGNTLVVAFKRNPSFEKGPLALKAMAATFKQAPGIENVRFMVGGQPQAVSNGQELGTVRLDSFRINDNLDAESPEEGPSSVFYYLLKGTPVFVPVTERVSAEVPLEDAVTQALGQSPPFSWALSSALPPGSRLVSVKRKWNRTLEVAVEWAGSAAEQKLARKALVLTYTEIPGVRRVLVTGAQSGFPVRWRASARPAVVNPEEP